ncbi:MAG: transcription termination/antitermination protein NusG [bacterium]|nr:transcription termination/antitermination protein NusG [bacterium]
MSNQTNEQESLIPPELEGKLCWYVVHTYSGYENKVMDTLKKSVENSEKMQKLIFEIVVPEEEVTEIKKGKRVKSRRKVFPGYVMIHMIWTTESWYLVRNTRGVTGFVGPESKPVALSEDEVERMLHPVPEEVKTDIAIGQQVRVLSGPLENYEVQVEDVDAIVGTVRVRVQMLGREQSVDLQLDQVQRIDD